MTDELQQWEIEKMGGVGVLEGPGNWRGGDFDITMGGDIEIPLGTEMQVSAVKCAHRTQGDEGELKHTMDYQF